MNLPPSEAAIVYRVYSEIINSPWFNRNAVTEREALKMIIALVSGLPDSESELLARCVAEAKARFSRRC